MTLCRLVTLLCGVAPGVLHLLPLAGASWTAPHGLTCRNPLFECAWADSHRSALGLKPRERDNLQLCPRYNGYLSCCSAGTEQSTLVPAFQEWQDWLGQILSAIDRVERELSELSVARPGDLEGGSHGDRQNLHAMLRHLGGLRTAAPPCFSAVLEYAAGMLCFSCDPQWRSFGVLNASAGGPTLFRVRVPDYEGRAVWSQCERFGSTAESAVRAMKAAQGGARQVLRLQTQRDVEARLEMFLSAAALQQGLYSTIALEPICPAGDRGRLLDALGVQAPAVARPGEIVLDVVQEGRSSAFETQWSRRSRAPGAPAAQGTRERAGAALLSRSAATALTERARAQREKLKAELLPWSPLLLVPLLPAVLACVCPAHVNPLAQFSERLSERRTVCLRREPAFGEAQRLLVVDAMDDSD